MTKILLLSLFLCSCTQLREINERGYAMEARKILLANVPKEIVERCGFDIEDPLPMIFAVDADSPWLAGASGRYYPDIRTIYYVHGQYSSVMHEATHDLLAYKPRECIHEVAAYYAERISTLQTKERRYASFR